MFIISHFANSDSHNIALTNCVRSIRLHYGDIQIYIIDDHSTVPIPLAILSDINISIQENPYKHSGEVGCLYWYLKNPQAGEYAFIIHDSMYALSYINPERCIKLSPCNMLWYFDKAFGYHIPRIMNLLNGMNLPKELVNKFQNDAGTKWHGCFGISVLITHKRLESYQDNYNLFSQIQNIKTREDREAFERIMGLIICTAENKCPYLCGNIFNHPAMNTSAFSTLSFDDIQKVGSTYKSPFLKSWFGR